jgi:hypothetical protein
MSYLKKLWANATSTYQLKEGYYKLTSIIGCLIVLAGATLMAFVVSTLISTFNIDTNLPLNQWENGSGYMFVALIPIFFVISLIPSVILIAGLASTCLILAGQMTVQQAKKYVFFGEYPKHWFKNT